MAAPSRPPNFAQYGIKQVCGGCGRKLKATEPLWFTGFPRKAAFGLCCFRAAAQP